MKRILGLGWRATLAVLSTVLLLVPAAPALAHGDGFPPDCNIYVNGPYRDNGTNLIYVVGVSSCDYQHDRNVVETELKWSSSGNAGTFNTIATSRNTTYNTTYVQSRAEKNVCTQGNGYFKGKVTAWIYNNSGQLVHYGENNTNDVFFSCIVSPGPQIQ